MNACLMAAERPDSSNLDIFQWLSIKRFVMVDPSSVGNCEGAGQGCRLRYPTDVRTVQRRHPQVPDPAPSPSFLSGYPCNLPRP